MHQEFVLNNVINSAHSERVNLRDTLSDIPLLHCYELLQLAVVKFEIKTEMNVRVSVYAQKNSLRYYYTV